MRHELRRVSVPTKRRHPGWSFVLLFTVLALCAGIAALKGDRQAPLYPLRFHQGDKTDISMALILVAIPHTRELTVPVDRLAEARAVVAQSGLPHRPVQPLRSVDDLTPRAYRLRLDSLEKQLGDALAQMRGIEHSKLRLFQPENGGYIPGTGRLRPVARVIVMPKRGHKLTVADGKAVVLLVRTLVPEIEVEDVIVMDDQLVEISPRPEVLR